jgi:putative ABC transport system permease protein
VIVNETAAKLLGLHQDPLNKKIMSLLDNNAEKTISYKVVGVVKDFHFESLHSDIGALCLFLNLSRGNVSFRLNAQNDMTNTIRQIESKWKELAPGQPFSYSFMGVTKICRKHFAYLSYSKRYSIYPIKRQPLEKIRVLNY